MSSDLLFSVLPREGKVPIAHDSQKVVRIDKQENLRTLSDEEKELKGEEKEARQKQQRNSKKHRSEQAPNADQSDAENVGTEQEKPKGPKHLDIYV